MDKWSHHQADLTAETILEFPASPLLIKWHGVETVEVLEFLRILYYRLPSLSELEELHLLSI